MATLQDILSGNFPAAQRYAEGYAQMPSYLQDPYLGLSTSQIGNVTKGLLGIKTPEEFASLAKAGKINIAKNETQEISGLLSGKSKFAELPNLNWDDPKTYDLVDPLIEKGFKAKTIQQGPDSVTLLYKNPKDIKLLETAKNPYEYGKAYGYSDADIAHFYQKQFGDNGFNMLLEAMGKNKSPSKTEIISKTQFEKAQEIASKNAEKLLGLPKGNTAMDRAKALSFEFGYGHGSSNPNITELLPSKMGAEGTGVYATNYLPETALYAGKEIGATSYPLAVRTDRTLNVGNSNPFEYLKESGTENLSKKLNKLGKDAIIRTHEETPEWLIQAGADNFPARQHYVSNVSANFRSPFAAFDPARANEPDLLAGLLAIPVGESIIQDKKKKKK